MVRLQQRTLEDFGMLLLIDKEVLESSMLLDRINLTMQFCCPAEITVMQPRVINNYSTRQLDGSILTSEITSMAVTIKTAYIKFKNWCLPNSGLNKGRRLIGIDSITGT